MEMLQKLKNCILSEKCCFAAFMLSLTANHIAEYYFDGYLKFLFILCYLWTLLIYLYHTMVTRKYLQGTLFRAAQVFLLINIVCTFVRPANLRFSVLQDFAQLVLYLFPAMGAYYHLEGKDEREGFEKLLAVFLVLTFIVSLASIIAIETNSSLVWVHPNYSSLRKRGFYYETNEGAFDAFASILIGMYFFRKNRRIHGNSPQKSDALYLLNIPIQLYMIVSTSSRTTLLVLILMIFAALFRTLASRMREGKLPSWVFYGSLGVCAFAVYLLLFTRYGFRRNLYYYFRGVSLQSLSGQEWMDLLSKITSYRFYIWKTSLEEIAKSPLIGYGLKSANFTYTVYQNYSNSHNLIINTLLFSGILGLLSLWALLSEAYSQIRRRRRYSEDRAVLMLIIGFILISMLEIAFLYNGKAVSVLVWVAVGFMASPKDEIEADAESSITMFERARNIAAWLASVTGITAVMMKRCYRNRQVIRVVNYHRTPANELETFEKQLQWYRHNFVNIDRRNFERFMNRKVTLGKPGIILSFDDGLLNNYELAAPLLEKYGFTGWFFVSSGLADGTEYMTYEDMNDLLQRGHVLGVHTYSHHRMEEGDTEEVLYHEIVEAKQKLEEETGCGADLFCWCGGEEETYTAEAAKLVRKHYAYGFMTNNEPVTPDTDHYQIQRTNVEARWPLASAKLQLSGFMDGLYRKKRDRVNEKTRA